MAYCTTQNVKDYLGLSSTGDDTLIAALIVRAQKWLDTYTGRVFESSTGTRRFTVGKDTDVRTLYLDEDLVSVTAIVNKADAATTETISASEYTLMPRNRTPYYAIRLLDSSDKDWDYDDDPEMGITVSGAWGYSTTPPSDIVHACVRLTGYLYRQKDAQVYDTTVVEGAGVTQIPVGIPKDVQIILAPYVKKIAVW